MTIAFAKHVLKDAAALAGVPTPKLVVRTLKEGYACYQPFSHQIVLSRQLCDRLERTDLAALLGHEIGHARQRKAILFDGMRLLMPGLGLMAAFAVFALVTAAYRLNVQAGGLGLAGIISYLLWDRWAMPKWMDLVKLRESDADAFAEKFVGRPGAMAQAMAACKRLHH